MELSAILPLLVVNGISPERELSKGVSYLQKYWRGKGGGMENKLTIASSSDGR